MRIQHPGGTVARVLIRRELATDRDSIRQVHAAAFARPERADSQPPEVALVDDLRAAGDLPPALSLVAVLDGQVVGHVCASPGRVAEAGDDVFGLGPIGVLPAHQLSGVGSALMHAVLAAVDALDGALVALLGDPGYYRRFGFTPATESQIDPPVADWAPHFQVRTLTAHRASLPGTFRYAPAFDRL